MQIFTFQFSFQSTRTHAHDRVTRSRAFTRVHVQNEVICNRLGEQPLQRRSERIQTLANKGNSFVKASTETVLGDVHIQRANTKPARFCTLIHSSREPKQWCITFEDPKVTYYRMSTDLRNEPKARGAKVWVWQPHFGNNFR